MKTPEFNFRKHQNHSKNWKMMIRFLIYSVVISILLYLIYNPKNTYENNINSDKTDQINLEVDDVIVN